MNSAKPAVEIVGLYKSFQDKLVINDLNLRFERGLTYGIVGPNGSGKTTLFRMINGALRPDSGEISVFGEPPSKLDRRRIGYMPQTVSLYGDLTVRENIRFFGEVAGLKADDAEVRIEKILTLTDLVPFQSQRVETLSGGQARRTSLAAAILHQPDLLFLDEPTAAVDPQLRVEFWDHFAELKSQGATLLVSTHHLDEAIRCDVLVLLRHGVRLASAAPTDLLEQTGATSIEDAFLHLSRAEAT